MKVLLIYDSFLDNGNFRNVSERAIEKFRQNDIQLIIYQISDEDLLIDEISRVADEDFEKIIILGNNRIVNLVINNILENNINLPIAIFTDDNEDNYKYFKINVLINEMINSVLINKYTTCNIGFVNKQNFTNHVSIGNINNFDIEQDNSKENLNIVGNYITDAKELIQQRTFNVKIKSDAFDFEGEILYMLITPNTFVSDGVFDVVIIKKCSVNKAVKLMKKIANAEKIKSRYLINVNTKELYVDSADLTNIIIDGEKKLSFPLELKLIPQKLYISIAGSSAKWLNKKYFVMCRSIRKPVQLLNIKKAASAVIYDFKRFSYEKYKKRNIVKDMLFVLIDLRRHNPFNYVNKNSIGNEYFDTAKTTLNNGYLYIIISNTGSPAGEVACRYTKKEYSHSSISFDAELKTIISYNGGEKIFSPGLNHENMNFFCQKQDASLIVYKIKANHRQKKIILDDISRINEQGSSFNLLGILSYSHKRNIMFCSQFVYTMLKDAGLEYFVKKAEDVRPTDFIELDYDRVLRYCNKFYVRDILDNNGILAEHRRLAERKV